MSVSIWSVVAGFLDPWEVRALGRTCRDCHLATHRSLTNATSGFTLLRAMGVTGVSSDARAAAVEQSLTLLRNAGFLDETPQKLAQFITKATQGDRHLPSVALCYMLTPMRWPQLSSDDAWHQALPFVDAYLESFHLGGTSVTQAMRQVLHFTGIPQSTRSMTLLLRRLAKRYYVSAVEGTAPQAYPDRDTVYLCMYSAVILNGDLRNPAIKPAWKMTRQRFVANNLVVVPGVGEACLASIYDDIAAHGLPVRGWEGEVEEAGGLGHGAAHRAASAMRAVATATAPPVRALCAAFTSVSNVVSAGAADVMRSLRGFL